MLQLLPIERAAKKEKKQKQSVSPESDDDEEEDDEEEEGKPDFDSDIKEEEDTLQTNIDEIDTFRLPKAEETEKEGK